MKKVRWLLIVFLVGSLTHDVNEVAAQRQSGGAFSRTGGQSNFGAGANSAFGGGRQSVFDQNQFGGAQQGQFGQVGGSAGQRNGRNQLQGRNQDRFVGSDADQIRNQQLSGRQRRRAMFDFAVESLNEMRESRRRRDANRNRQPPVRVKVKPRFAVAPPNSTQLVQSARESLERALPANQAELQVAVEGGTATVQGKVGSEYDRKLAAKMLSMTPGIYRVDNQLAIEPNPSMSSSEPTR